MGASGSKRDSDSLQKQNGNESINLIRSFKSPNIIQLVFSNVIKNKELDIIKYNKKLQKQFNYSIEDYKQISKKYIIGERDGKGEEYNEYDELIFEGEYKNGKKNGKGKEYDEEENIIFEGEYKNGKRNGKGNEYDFNRKVIFEGVYKNGKKKEM